MELSQFAAIEGLQMSRLAFVAGLLAIVTQLPGCTASPVRFNAMIPPSFTGVAQHSGTVSISVEGSRKELQWYATGLVSEEISQALDTAIHASRVFEDVRRREESDFHLNVILRRPGIPVHIDTTVILESEWSLVDRNGKAIWRDTIQGESTARFSKYPRGTDRMQRASEGAVRATIWNGLANLSDALRNNHDSDER